MKGKVWGEHKHKLRYPVLAEVKHDEIRLHVKLVNGAVQLLSYAGKPLHNLSQFAQPLHALLHREKLTELDLGVEVNGNYNDSYRWVRSSNGAPKDLTNAEIKLFLFDCPEIDKAFAYRVGELDYVARQGAALGLPMHRPEGFQCHDEEQVNQAFIQVREAGYEGLMVKSYQHTYQRGKRIDGWLKMKPEETFDGRITAINEAVALDGTPHGRAGSVTVLLEDESTARPSGIEHTLATHMFEYPHLYIGRWLEFKCMERDRQGGYRHPVFYRFREDKQ
jgi:hypothetical protein